MQLLFGGEKKKEKEASCGSCAHTTSLVKKIWRNHLLLPSLISPLHPPPLTKLPFSKGTNFDKIYKQENVKFSSNLDVDKQMWFVNVWENVVGEDPGNSQAYKISLYFLNFDS